MTLDPLNSFLAERERLTAARTLGPWTDAGTIISEALTERLDEAVRALAGTDPPGSVLAVGGYGRSELCLHSDVDLMVLHDGPVPEDWVQSLLYPLWDARLKVGHSVRTPDDAVSAARENIETLTSLVGARLVAGRSERWEQTRASMQTVFRKERDWIMAALKAEERRRRSDEPFRLLAADVKSGRGGLRSLHTLGWERSTRALDLQLPLMSGDEEEVRRVLLAVRNALHAVTGRPHDVYEPDLRGAVADWLGAEVDVVGYQLYGAVRRVESMIDDRWPDLPDELTDPFRSAGRWLVRAVRRGGISDTSGALAIVSTALSRPGGQLFTSIEELKLANAPPPAWTAEDRATLVRLVASPERGHRIADRLHRLGYLEKALPELSATFAMPEAAPFHEHTVDDHQWRTVHEVLSVIDPDGSEPWCSPLAEDLGSLDELLLASLLHDVGKGRGGDHSVIGAQLVEAFGRRAGFGPVATSHMTNAVRWHLLLPQAATRRDIDSPEVVDDVADRIGDPQLARMLALLSVGDARATGHAVWSPWKASLLRTLTSRVLERFSTDSAPLDDLGEFVQTLGPSERVAALDHVGSMGPGYLARFDISEVRRHLTVAMPRPQRAVVDANHQGDLTSLVVAAPDRPGLLSMVAGVLALHGIGVLDARLLVSSDGLALDTFYVTNARRPGRVSDHTLELVRRDLARVLDGELDLEAALVARQRASSRPVGRAIDPEIRFAKDRTTGEDIVEVRAEDRVGLLHDIAVTLSEAELDIRVAKIETRGSTVVDVFYLRSANTDPARLQARLLARLR